VRERRLERQLERDDYDSCHLSLSWEERSLSLSPLLDHFVEVGEETIIITDEREKEREESEKLFPSNSPQN